MGNWDKGGKIIFHGHKVSICSFWHNWVEHQKVMALKKITSCKLNHD